MPEETSETIERLQAEKAARKAAGDRAPDDPKVIWEDQGEAWKFVFLPQGRVRGGGVRVIVKKETHEINEIVRLQ